MHTSKLCKSSLLIFLGIMPDLLMVAGARLPNLGLDRLGARDTRHQKDRCFILWYSIHIYLLRRKGPCLT